MFFIFIKYSCTKNLHRRSRYPFYWIHLSTINTGDISKHDKRPLSSHTGLVYPSPRVAVILEDARTRVHASNIAPVKRVGTLDYFFFISLRPRLNGRHFAHEFKRFISVFCMKTIVVHFLCHSTLLPVVELTLTHNPLVPHICVSELGNHLFS